VTGDVAAIGSQSSGVTPRMHHERGHERSGWPGELARQWRDGTTRSDAVADDAGHIPGSESTLCKRVQLLNRTAHVASPKPVPPHALPEKK